MPVGRALFCRPCLQHVFFYSLSLRVDNGYYYFLNIELLLFFVWVFVFLEVAAFVKEAKLMKVCIARFYKKISKLFDVFVVCCVETTAT